MNDMNQIEIKISNEEINYKEAVLFMESKVCLLYTSDAADEP